MTWLTTLPRLATLSLLLPWLLARSLARLPPACQRLDLIAEPLHVIQRSGLVAPLWLTLTRSFARAQTLLRLVDLLAQLVESFGDAFFGSVRIGVNPPAQPVGSPLDPVCQIRLVHSSKSIAQF